MLFYSPGEDIKKEVTMLNKNLIKPVRLRKGDTIGLVCPSEPVYRPERLEGGIKELESLGFKCVVGETAKKQHGYMAGTDQERADDLNNMFADPLINGIISITGGSSANRILSYLNYELIRKNPKVFLGISDISVLLNAIHAKTNLVTFHGPYVIHGICEMSYYDRDYFKRALMNTKPVGTISEFVPRKVLKEGIASGPLIGGNLSSLRSVLGTPYEPDWRGKILFWEEYKTEPHNIDRMLCHLKLAGVLEKITGLISGNLTMCQEKKYAGKSLEIEEIILDHCRDYGFPIMTNMDFGHNCQNVTIPLGVKGTINTYQNKFSIDENGVV